MVLANPFQYFNVQKSEFTEFIFQSTLANSNIKYESEGEKEGEDAKKLIIIHLSSKCSKTGLRNNTNFK